MLRSAIVPPSVAKSVASKRTFAGGGPAMNESKSPVVRSHWLMYLNAQKIFVAIHVDVPLQLPASCFLLQSATQT